MSTALDSMIASPLDRTPQTPEAVPLRFIRSAPQKEWVPSRFNARTITDDGRMILWNTYTTAISVFESKHRPALESYLRRTGSTGELSVLGQYLYDRGFIIEKDTDEMRRFRLLFGQQHYRTDLLELILLASEDCNFRCTYCYEDFKRGTMLPEVRQGVKNLVLKRVPQLTTLHTSWFGGEPLYGIDAIRDLAPFFVKVANDNNIALRGHMTTNAYLLTPDVAEELLSWSVDNFQITLDGPAETHDKKRIGRDGQPTFHTIYDNLRSLSKRPEPFVVSIRVNYDRDNYPHLESFLDALQKDFAADPRFVVRFRAVMKWGGSNDESLDICGVEQQQDVQRRITKLAMDKGFRVTDGIKDVNRPGRSVCYAARPFNFIVGADGKLMKCTIVLDKEDHNIVGRLSPDGEITLNPDRFARWTEAAFENDNTCRSCYILPVCQGIECPLVRINTGERACCHTKSDLKESMLQVLRTSSGTARVANLAPV